MANNTSQHILGTAANLIGFCLIVITSNHFSDKSKDSIVDELTSIVALQLTVASVFSFISIRSQNVIMEKRNEKIAEYIFLSALIGVFSIILFIVINFWGK